MKAEQQQQQQQQQQRQQQTFETKKLENQKSHFSLMKNIGKKKYS